MSVKPTKYCIDPRALAGSVPYVPVACCIMHIGKFFLIIVRYVKYSGVHAAIAGWWR